jgi:hypothetical protein
VGLDPPDSIFHLSAVLCPADSFEAWCQKVGSQTAGGNPYWVYVILPTVEDWMASYSVDQPGNDLPNVLRLRHA